MDRAEFAEIAEAYDRETGIHSLPGPMRNTPSYQLLITAGESVVPFIIEAFEKREHWGMNWVLVLMTITGESPIKPEPVAGGGFVAWDTEKTCDAWVQWWRDKESEEKRELRMQYQIAVITRVPDPETEDGNMASAIVYKLPPEQRFAIMINGRMPVFSLGEILILDPSGREVAGLGRKPSKWDVDVEEFDSLEVAIARAREVISGVPAGEQG